MDVTIVAIIHNSKPFITNLLHSLGKIRCNQYFLLNGMLDVKSIKLFEDYKKNKTGVKVLKTERLERHAIAINMLLAEVKTKYVFIMDSDILTTENDLAKIYSFMQEDNKHGAVQGLLLYPQTNTVQSSGHLFYEHWDYYGHLNCLNLTLNMPRKRQALSAGFAMYPTELVNSLGGFNEFYLHQMDGVEFSTRVLRSGHNVYCLPTAKGYHFHSLFRKSIINKPKNEIGKYWSEYGSDIKDDLIDEILDSPLYNYFSDYQIIDCCTIRDINYFLESLRIKNKPILKVTDLIEPEIILHNVIPHTILNSTNKILWVCTNLSQIVNNKSIFSNINRKNDFIIDMSANVVPVKVLI